MLRKTVVLSLIPNQDSINLNPKKTVFLSLIPNQDSINPNPKKDSSPEFDSYPR